MEVTCFSYTGLTVELEHLKIETRLTIEKFTSVMGEYVTER
jgi:hypothetical protein